MTQLSLSVPITNLPNSTEDPKIAADLTAIQTVVNGGLDYSNFAGGDGIHRFSYRLCTSNATAVSGDWIVAGPGVTITLPAPTKNLTVAITGQGTVTSASPVTVAGSNIYGVGLSAASSFKLGVALASVILQADNAGNWLIISGQQDTGWVPLTLAANVTNLNAGNFAPAARLLGRAVQLRGIATSSAHININTPIATLPQAAMNPSSVVYANVMFSPNTTANGQSFGVLINPGSPGLLLPYLNSSVQIGTNIYLDGVEFSVS